MSNVIHCVNSVLARLKPVGAAVYPTWASATGHESHAGCGGPSCCRRWISRERPRGRFKFGDMFGWFGSDGGMRGLREQAIIERAGRRGGYKPQILVLRACPHLFSSGHQKPTNQDLGREGGRQAGRRAVAKGEQGRSRHRGSGPDIDPGDSGTTRVRNSPGSDFTPPTRASHAHSCPPL